jgi:hypothetical protein
MGLLEAAVLRLLEGNMIPEIKLTLSMKYAVVV